MFTKLARWAAAILAFLVALRIAYFRLGTVFATWDDEGYVLLSLKHYIAGGHLYTQVYTQYGPVFYFVQSFLFRLLNQPLTHDGGRLVTLILWLAASLTASWFVYRISRNLLLSSAAGVVLMALCGISLSNEPSHPQHIILLLLMLACLASTIEGPLAFLLLGVIGCSLVFIKINVGVFFFAALCATLVCILRSGIPRKIAAAIFAAYFLLGPVALMHRDLHIWAMAFCMLVVWCGLATFGAALLTAPKFASPRALLWIIAGAALVSLAVIVATTLEGMSIHTLLDNVIFAPLRQPQLFELPWFMRPREVIAPAIVVVAIGILWLRARDTPSATTWIALVRGAAGLYIVATILIARVPLLASALPFLPLALLPVEGRRWHASTYLPRLFITLLAACELLQTYPVAGGQVGISAAPVVLWAFLCIADATLELRRRFPALTRSFRSLPATGTLLGLFLLLCVEAQALRPGMWRMRFKYPSSALRGSQWLHLDPGTELTFEGITSDISHNCDMLFTLPGMGSFNLWSEAETPNGIFLTAWVKALSPDQQAEIRRILSADPNACVVVKPNNIWQATDADLAASPLASYILREMKPVDTIGEYEIRVSPHRTRPWIETASSSKPSQARFDQTPSTVFPTE